MERTLNPSAVRVIPLELIRFLLNLIPIRGRFRLANLVSKVLFTKESLLFGIETNV